MSKCREPEFIGV